jgi:hypothetical protein
VVDRYSTRTSLHVFVKSLLVRGVTDRPIDPSIGQAETDPIAGADRISVLERYLAGETANSLADEFDENRATVFAILQRRRHQVVVSDPDGRRRCFSNRDVRVGPVLGFDREALRLR